MTGSARRRRADVAEEHGMVRGYVRLSQPGPLPSHAHVLVINGLAVDPVRQGHGIGSRLIAAALDEARARGARKVSLRVLAPSLRARSLYASCGFVAEEVLQRELLLDAEYVDDILMARHLTDQLVEAPPSRRTALPSTSR